MITRPIDVPIPSMTHRIIATGIPISAVIGSLMTVKIALIFGLSSSSGVVFYPLSFMLIAILAECYGYRAARQVIWVTVIWMILTAAALGASDLLPSAPFWHHQREYHLILGAGPQVLYTSLASFTAGVFSVAAAIAYIKRKMKGRFVLARIAVIPFIGVMASVLMFYAAYYLPNISSEQFTSLIVSRTVIALVEQAVMTPVLLVAIHIIRHTDKVNVIEEDFSLNLID